jgi:hypothetical protein
VVNLDRDPHGDFLAKEQLQLLSVWTSGVGVLQSGEYHADKWQGEGRGGGVDTVPAASLHRGRGEKWGGEQGLSLSMW